MNLEKGAIFVVLSFGISAMIMSTYNITVQPFSVATFAQENQTGSENEAEIEADIEQENKCKKDSDCENENEINNSLDITNTNQTGESQTQTTLNVIKLLTCILENESVPCGEFEAEDFTITVTGNNPEPSEFLGSSEGTLVTLGTGEYTVSELNDLIGVSVLTEFSGDCTQSDQYEAQGTIANGEEQTCTIENTVDLTNEG